MTDRILIINGPNLNLLGEREQSQYGSITFDQLKEKCLKKSKELNINLDFMQSNIEGEIVTIIQDSRNKYDGMIINAAGFTHTSVSIRDAEEYHISNTLPLPPPSIIVVSLSSPINVKALLRTEIFSG